MQGQRADRADQRRDLIVSLAAFNKLDLIVDMKAAATVGVAIPRWLLLRAAEVIG